MAEVILLAAVGATFLILASMLAGSRLASVSRHDRDLGGVILGFGVVIGGTFLIGALLNALDIPNGKALSVLPDGQYAVVCSQRNGDNLVLTRLVSRERNKAPEPRMYQVSRRAFVAEPKCFGETLTLDVVSGDGYRNIAVR